MKRYLAFYGSVYYPCGGMDDFIGDFETKQEAIDSIELKNKKEDGGNFNYCWGNVYDTEDRIETYTK